MAGGYKLRDGKKGTSKYGGRNSMSVRRKGGYKKKPASTLAQKKSVKAETEALIKTLDHSTVACLDGNFAAVAGKSSCVTMIPVQITQQLQTNWARFIADKYEEYRIAKMEVKIMFDDHKTPVWYLIDKENTKMVTPEQFENDNNAGYKMVKENNNTLILTWKPAETTDYEYKPVNASPHNDVPLGYVKVLQHGIDKAVGEAGCNIFIKLSIACRGRKEAPRTVALTAAQQAAIDSCLN